MYIFSRILLKDLENKLNKYKQVLACVDYLTLSYLIFYSNLIQNNKDVLFNFIINYYKNKKDLLFKNINSAIFKIKIENTHDYSIYVIDLDVSNLKFNEFLNDFLETVSIHTFNKDKFKNNSNNDKEKFLLFINKISKLIAFDLLFFIVKTYYINEVLLGDIIYLKYRKIVSYFLPYFKNKKEIEHHYDEIFEKHVISLSSILK